MGQRTEWPGSRPARFWRDEASGALKPVVEAYLAGKPLTPDQLALMREYLRHWMEAPNLPGPLVVHLREMIGDLTTIDRLEKWLELALHEGIDPL